MKAFVALSHSIKVAIEIQNKDEMINLIKEPWETKKRHLFDFLVSKDDSNAHILRNCVVTIEFHHKEKVYCVPVLIRNLNRESLNIRNVDFTGQFRVLGEVEEQ